MWGIILNILYLIVGFYLFCICIAYVFMYKPNKHFLNEIKSTKHAYIFSLLGLTMWVVLEKVKIPDKWFNLVYKGCFLTGGVVSFIFMVSSL
jgi:hypothetical protein